MTWPFGMPIRSPKEVSLFETHGVAVLRRNLVKPESATALLLGAIETNG